MFESSGTGVGRTALEALVGNVIVGALVILLFGGVAAACVRIAVRTWKDPGRFDETASAFRVRAGKPTSNGLARGVAVFAAQWVCMACAVVLVVIGGGPRPSAWTAAAGVFFAGFFVGFPLLFSISIFNRPRSLVVPYKRNLDRAAIRAAARRS